MKNNKRPGSDGFTVEFYKLFWNSIKDYNLALINYSFKTTKLTTLQRQGIMSVIPKTGLQID
jgi:hypothetical protein